MAGLTLGISKSSESRRFLVQKTRTAQKMRFFVKEILNKNLHFLCSIGELNDGLYTCILIISYQFL